MSGRFQCPICNQWFEPYAGMTMRKDNLGAFWCLNCLYDFDSIDWEQHNE